MNFNHLFMNLEAVMPKRRAILSASALFLATGTPVVPQDVKAVDWLRRLGDWHYPGSHFDGAGSAGTDQFDATMRTSDVVTDVVKYYEGKTGQSLTPTHPGAGYSKNMGDLHVFLKDASARRSFTLRIFTQVTKESSITLVISRGDEEKITLIYWSLAEH